MMRIPFILLVASIMISITSCSINSEEDILVQIETYAAPPYPKSEYINKETYDYRIKSNNPVPPTLTDVFICDIWKRMVVDLDIIGLSFFNVKEEKILKALRIYKEKSYNNIAGYRPYTHSYFINSLNESELKILSRNIAEYIHKNGVKESEEN